MPEVIKLENAYYDELAAATSAALDRREQLFADLADALDEALFGTGPLRSYPHAR